jgi:hypothetical protein
MKLSLDTYERWLDRQINRQQIIARLERAKFRATLAGKGGD